MPFWIRGVTASGYGTAHGMQGMCILGLHRTYFGILREGTKGEERVGSRLLRAGKFRKAVSVCVCTSNWREAAPGGLKHPSDSNWGDGSRLNIYINMCVYIYPYLYIFTTRKSRMRLFMFPVLVCLLYVFVCVTCVLVVHVPNENKCSALTLAGCGDVEQWQPPLSVSQSWEGVLAKHRTDEVLREWILGAGCVFKLLSHSVEERREVFSEVGVLMKREKCLHVF